MSKTETWRDAARQQNEANLLSRADLLSKLAESAEILAESMARLSEETRETVSGLANTIQSVEERTNIAASAQQKAMQELTAAVKETRSAMSAWKNRLETSVDECERRIKGSLRGIKIKLWLAAILSAILGGALSGWLIFQWLLSRYVIPR